MEDECAMKMKTMPSTTAAAATRGTTDMALDCCRAGRDGRLLGVCELRIVFLSLSHPRYISVLHFPPSLLMSIYHGRISALFLNGTCVRTLHLGSDFAV